MSGKTVGTAPQTAAAALEVEAARTQLLATIHELQDRLQPRTVMHNGVDRLRDRTRSVAVEVIDAAAARPELVGAIGAGALLLYLRRPLGRMVRRLFLRRDETDHAAGQLKRR